VDLPTRRSFVDLEWDRIVAAVAHRCVGPAAALSELPMTTTPEGMRVANAETAEAWALADMGEPLPLDGLRQVRPQLERVGKQGVLEAAALRDVGMTLAAARVLRKFLGRRRARAPALHRACALDPTLDTLEEAIGDVIGPDGAIVDGATPELRRLRTEVANLRGRIVSRLEAMIHKHADILQDRYHTLREGRYVLPVRTDAHEKLPGIVHGTSASGATVFVEPRPVVTQGNRLKMAQGEMEREEHRILAGLSERVRDRAAEIGAAADAMDRADLRNAAAALGRHMGGRMLTLSDRPRMVLRAARHPGLVLSGASVVASDLSIEGGRALVLSGPNAGGKTVALKTLGLAAWMARAGLPFPCGEGSECGWFDPILTDVGDEQSIAKNLSTFSAHVTNLADILRSAGEGALVLLDELAGSTDPQEGAALACAIVTHLCERGAASAVTTHYEALKALGEVDPRLDNASVGFDVERMEPTFELTLGVPGASSALAVAGRFGIPHSILDEARRVLPEQARTFDELVQALQSRARGLEREREELEVERRRIEALRAESERRLERVRTSSRAALDPEVEALRVEVRTAHQELDSLRKQLRRERVDEEAVRAARKVADQAARKLTEAERAAAPPPGVSDASVPSEEDLAVGDRVWVTRLNAEADVIEGAHRGRVRVAAGPMKLWVEMDGLRRVSGGRERQHGQAPVQAAQPRGAPGRTTDNTLDVRGLRVDDALSLSETFLDRLYGDGQPVGYILHGIGTGALRDALRAHLGQRGAPVHRVRPGEADEGGDRVTVVLLR
jgi:DNA mismatch repair protein MutS2